LIGRQQEAIGGRRVLPADSVRPRKDEQRRTGNAKQRGGLAPDWLVHGRIPPRHRVRARGPQERQALVSCLWAINPSNKRLASVIGSSPESVP
jgi:hypothetical protein